MIRFRLLLLFTVLAASIAGAETRAESLARFLRETGLDPEECYRVRDLNFAKEDLKFYLTDGFLIFGKPVEGRRISAVFSGEVEGGDGEVLLIPPHRSERQSLGAYTGSPNLNEHFKTALFLFPSVVAEDLLARARRDGRKQSERGILLDAQYSPALRHIAESFQMRLVEDLLTPGGEGALFFGAIVGKTLGNFDVVADARSREQILVGQFAVKGNAPSYNIWASFESRSIRSGKEQRVSEPFAARNYRIEANLDDSLHLSAITRFELTPSRNLGVFPFDISDRMKVTGVRINGEPVEIFSRESMRASAIGGGDNAFLVVTAEPLTAGKTYEVEFRHEGDVVLDAGNGVYSVAARNTWYPNAGLQFSNYDLVFHYPKRLNLVSTGEWVEERVEGDARMTHRRTSGPVRMAGFNLGAYRRVSTTRAGYTIEVYGNRHLEPPLETKSTAIGPAETPSRPARYRVDLARLDNQDSEPSAGSALSPLAADVAGAFEFMVRQFGPPPLKTLTVAPIPGTFGQGFPGLVYLSTISYLLEEQRPNGMRNRSSKTFFSDVLAPHEVAHQWWGNLVTTDSYQDVWLTEALAQYSALMYLEKRKGRRAMEAVLEEYRTHLLTKTEDGNTVESAGPIAWGARLASSSAKASWRTIEYEKGGWIMHMLRIRLGDERFFKMLNELCKRYAYKAVSTSAFRKLAEEFSPVNDRDSLDSFFESWVYGTGIPAIKLSSSIKGRAPAVRVTGIVTLTEVDEDFGTDVPVELQFSSGPSQVIWVRTSGEPATFAVDSKRLPVRVMVSPSTVLARK